MWGDKAWEQHTSSSGKHGGGRDTESLEGSEESKDSRDGVTRSLDQMESTREEADLDRSLAL